MEVQQLQTLKDWNNLGPVVSFLYISFFLIWICESAWVSHFLDYCFFFSSIVGIIHPKIFMIPCVLIDPDLFLSRSNNETQIPSYACREEKKPIWMKYTGLVLKMTCSECVHGIASDHLPSAKKEFAQTNLLSWSVTLQFLFLWLYELLQLDFLSVIL